MRVLESVATESRGSFPSPAAWDEFVARAPEGHLLQTWAWGELKGAFGWTPLRYLVERDGAPVAGAQVLYRRIGPFTLGYIPKGPVLVDADPETETALWHAIHRRSRRMRALALKVEPEWDDADRTHHDWLAGHGFAPSPEYVQPRRTIMVDLCGDEDEILGRMKSKWRYNIRLSARKEVEVREGTADDIAAFYRLMEVTGERDNFGIHSLEYYHKAYDLFAPHDRVRLFLAYHQDRLLAGLMAYAFGRYAFYMYGASDNEGRELMPNHALQWRAMQWAREKSCVRYDLWGITDSDEGPSAALAGVERFKAGFGGEIVRYVGAYDYVYLPPLYWLMRQAWARRRARSAAIGG
ncbi:MAG TPA: peptidoglycan bridge formation glycyltransferase FemA/FemB family protein [Chloroflexi bacterium]|nr:peptidoglycan bridge formation glycyltransferase FemA/FemB family protein [Chloroflexota bacterium]